MEPCRVVEITLKRGEEDARTLCVWWEGAYPSSRCEHILLVGVIHFVNTRI